MCASLSSWPGCGLQKLRTQTQKTIPPSKTGKAIKRCQPCSPASNLTSRQVGMATSPTPHTHSPRNNSQWQRGRLSLAPLPAFCLLVRAQAKRGRNVRKTREDQLFLLLVLAFCQRKTGVAPLLGRKPRAYARRSRSCRKKPCLPPSQDLTEGGENARPFPSLLCWPFFFFFFFFFFPRSPII